MRKMVMRVPMTVSSSCLAAASRTLIYRRQFSSSPSSKATWGFVGLGQMGYNMARNLRQKLPRKDVLVIQDINTNATKKFVEETSGHAVVIAKSVREVAEKAEITITALPSPPHVKSVYQEMLSPSPLPTLSNPRLFIDTSTIDPSTSIAVAETITKASAGLFIDAPMSGGVVGAQAGTLTFMLGSPESLVPKATEVLGMMGKRVIHMGPPGSGLKAKLANNYLLALNNIATCEAMNMGIQWGLDPKALAGLINISTGKCWPSEVNNPVPGVKDTAPASRDYDGGFGVALMNKDLKLALKACEDYGVRLEMGAKARDIYDAIEGDAALKSKDFSVAYRWLGGKE